MPDEAMTVEVVTPEQALLSGGAQALVLRSSDGDLTVLPGHTPLVADVVPGQVRVDQGEGEPVRLAVHGGYLHVDTPSSPPEEGALGIEGVERPEGSPAATRTQVRLLAGVAELSTEIDVDRAQRALEESQAQVNELRAATGRAGEAGGEEPAQPSVALSEAEAALRRAEVRLSVARGDEGTA